MTVIVCSTYVGAGDPTIRTYQSWDALREWSADDPNASVALRAVEGHVFIRFTNNYGDRVEAWAEEVRK